jgi:hypothetical protein
MPKYTIQIRYRKVFHHSMDLAFTIFDDKRYLALTKQACWPSVEIISVNNIPVPEEMLLKSEFTPGEKLPALRVRDDVSLEDFTLEVVE